MDRVRVVLSPPMVSEDPLIRDIPAGVAFMVEGVVYERVQIPDAYVPTDLTGRIPGYQTGGGDLAWFFPDTRGSPVKATLTVE